MILRKTLFALSLCLFLDATAAMAQPAGDPNQFHFFLGYSPLTGKVEKYLDAGWNFGFGGTWNPNRQKNALSLRWDVTYDWWDANLNAIEDQGVPGSIRADDGDADLWTGRVGVQFDSHNSGKVRWHGGVGLGAYRLHGDLSVETLVSYIYCDPWWGWCYPVTGVGEAVTQSKTVTKLGYYADLGLDIELTNSDFFIEAQYNYAEYQEAFESTPIVLGWRW
jgi:hypothetical protein